MNTKINYNPVDFMNVIVGSVEIPTKRKKLHCCSPDLVLSFPRGTTVWLWVRVMGMSLSTRTKSGSKAAYLLSLTSLVLSGSLVHLDTTDHS